MIWRMTHNYDDDNDDPAYLAHPSCMMVRRRVAKLEVLQVPTKEKDEEEEGVLVVRPGPRVGIEGSQGPGEDIVGQLLHPDRKGRLVKQSQRGGVQVEGGELRLEPPEEENPRVLGLSCHPLHHMFDVQLCNINIYLNSQHLNDIIIVNIQVKLTTDMMSTGAVKDGKSNIVFDPPINNCIREVLKKYKVFTL
jgi:hypothetical protein